MSIATHHDRIAASGDSKVDEDLTQCNEKID